MLEGPKPSSWKRRNPPGFTKLTPYQFRNVILPAEAAKTLMNKAGIPPQNQKPRTDIAHRVLPVGAPEGLLVRTYTPLTGAKPFPVVVYYHGGGWVIADWNPCRRRKMMSG